MKMRLAWVAGLAMCIAAHAAARKPNIILIMADDMGYECVGANGCEDYKTPVIDRLAAEGVRFDQCFANPLCTPSRVKVMTGLYNKRNFTKFAHMDRDQITFAHQLKKVGYATAVAGKWQLGGQPDSAQHFGFDQSCLWRHNAPGSRYPNPGLSINGKPVQYSNGEYGPDVCTDFLCDFIETNKDKPFLAYYPMILPHCPFAPTPDSEDWDPAVTGWPYKGPGDEAMQQKNFKDMVQYIDKLVGKIVNKLDELGIRDNTMVIFTGDNGTDTPIVTNWSGKKVAGRKGKPFNAGVRVPLVINWPGRIKPAVQKDELVEFSDFLPTMCEIAGAPLPENYPGDGLSLWPVLAGTGERNKEHVYIWYFRFNTWVRTKDLGLLCSRENGAISYWKYPSHYETQRLESSSATEEEQVVLKRLEKVLDDMSTVDSLFMGVTAHKGRKATESTEKSPAEPAKSTPQSPTPAPVSVAVAPASTETAGTRYEAEAGEVSGGAKPRAMDNASGGSMLAGMQGASCTVNVDGGTGGGGFDLTIGYATAKNVACVLTLNGVEQRLQLPATGGWNTPGAARLQAELKPGENKIAFASQGGMKLDYFDLEARQKKQGTNREASEK